MRAAVFLVGGLCWFAAALFFGTLAWAYLGDDLQFFALSVSSGSALIGLIHVLGFTVGAGVCFAMGAGLCSHGLLPPVREQTQQRIRPLPVVPSFISGVGTLDERGVRCVRCEAALGAYVHVCPDCGWTQPVTLIAAVGALCGCRRLHRR